jgi:elongation factor 2
MLAKEPGTGFKAIFTDMVIHEDPRHTSYGQIAGMVVAALSLSMLTADPHVFEPIQKIDVKTPEGTEGGVTGILNKRRGRISNVIPEGEYVRVQATIPVAEIIGLADDIRGVTQGRAFFGYEFSGFNKVPGNMEEKLILEIRKRKGLKEELPDSKNFDRFIYKRT